MSSKKMTLWTMVCAAGLSLAALLAHQVIAQPQEQVIKVVAKKFDYTPSEIQLKKGVPVTLEFTADDVVMGFNVPELNARATIIPGKPVQVRLTPDKAGTFLFHCDIFCGTGHEDMTGTIVVTE